MVFVEGLDLIFEGIRVQVKRELNPRQMELRTELVSRF